MADVEEVLDFWLVQCSAADWYEGTAALDTRIRDRFEATWRKARDGRLGSWMTTPRGALALAIVTDQFARNMFRGTARAFASDPLALAIAKTSIFKGFDMCLEAPERQFMYMPLEHSERLPDQARAVRMMATRMPRSHDNLLLHARAHREIIRRFGRFPFRNAALGRRTTRAEGAFLDTGGYGALVRHMQDGGAWIDRDS